MPDVKEILTSAMELLVGDNIRTLVDQLAIISKVLYKTSNAQRRHKTHQAFRKLDRNMRKFTNVGLRTLIKRDLELLGNDDNFNPSYADEYLKEVDVAMKSSIILLKVAEANATEGVMLSKLHITTGHFIPQNMLLISCGSLIHNVVSNLGADMAVVYGHLCKISNCPDTLQARLDAIITLGDTTTKKKRTRPIKKSALKRFASSTKQNEAPPAKVQLTHKRKSEEDDEILDRVSKVPKLSGIKPVDNDYDDDPGEILSRHSQFPKSNINTHKPDLSSQNIGEKIDLCNGEDKAEENLNEESDLCFSSLKQVEAKDSTALSVTGQPQSDVMASGTTKKKRNRKRKKKNKNKDE